MNIIMTIISWIFIGIYRIMSFLFSHIINWIWTLIQQLTIKAWVLILWLAFISYVASHV